jgi:hypothetical protein
MKYTKQIKQAVEKLLSILFPFEDFNDRPSVFLQESWLSKIMQPTQVKDYLWTSK